MVQGSSDVSSLIDEVSSAFDALLSRNEAGAKLGPSPLNIYKASNLLYQLYQEPKLEQISQQTQQAFDIILASMSDEYLSSLLHDILEAFASLVQKAQKSLLDLTLQPNNRSLKDDLVKDLSKCFAALKPLQILFGYKLEKTLKNENMTETKKRCCRIGHQDSLFVHLAFLYDAACQIDSAAKIQNVILNIFSALLTHGLLVNIQSNSENEDDNVQQIMNLIQQITSEQGQSSTCLGDLLLYQKQQSFIPQHEYLPTMIETIFTSQVHAQKDYINLMLSSCPTSLSAKPVQVPKKPDSKSVTKPSKAKKISAMTRLVQQVQSVFGDTYGEGYIEAALACYNLNPEETTAALLELQTSSSTANNNVHPRLLKLDPKLPSSRKDRLNELMDDDNQEKKQASKIQKAYLEQYSRDQEQEAYLLGEAMGGMDEYNDDYDDQYDGVGGGEDGVGGLDGGLYDVDLEAIKTYNRITKGMEEERLFWEENRNTNRRQGRNNNGKKKKNKNDNDGNGDNDEEEQGEERKYRGADKGKGGRIIGPDGRYLPFPKSKKKGGGNKNPGGQVNVQNSNNDSNDKGDSQKKKSNDKKDASKEMSKLQKRRKNDNKSKIGNHHRKERALKKTAM